jgi:LacI family transcriptional regulator
LISKGHERIIHVTSNKIFSSAQERIEGFKLAHNEMGIPFNKKRIIRCDISSIQSCCEAMNCILDEHEDFTAVFAFNDFTAFGIMKALLERGLRIPEDVALIGYDNSEFADICAVPLTTVKQESYLIGKMAFNFLLERINGNSDSKVYHVIAPTQIIERKSV